MTDIFLTHGPQVRGNYYAARPLAQLQALGNVRLNDSSALLSLDEFVERASGCQIIVASREAAAPAELFERLPDLRAICRVAVDIRNIDVEAASRHGVLVTRATPGFDTSVSEWVIGVMIDLARGVSRAAADYWQGKTPEVLMGRELRGATLGLVGYGFIGQRLAQIARLLQMRVLVSDPHVAVAEEGIEQVSFEQVVSQSDYVVCLAPALPDTANLFGAEAFAHMRADAFFINASRGELVDEQALLAALDQQQIAGSALDVGRATDQMPSAWLAAHPKVIASPHIGGLTPQASEHQAMDTVRQVRALLNGAVPQGAVNLQQAFAAQQAFGLPQQKSGVTASMNTTTSKATDCHVHLYEPERFPIPSPVPAATWRDYQSVQQKLGLGRAVLVQPNGYGFDNTCLLDGLQQAGDSARGIAVIKAETPFSEILKLHEAGVRGVRFMIIAGAGGALGWDALEPLSAKIAELGWVINLQLDGRELAEHEARLRALPSKLSIDHTGKFLEPVGTEHVGFQALLRLLDGGKTWVKVSAPYETSKVGAPHYDDVSALAKALIAAHPARCLWASNWPHPGRDPKPDDGAMLELLNHWAPSEKVREQILVSNPAELYGFA